MVLLPAEASTPVHGLDAAEALSPGQRSEPAEFIRCAKVAVLAHKSC